MPRIHQTLFIEAPAGRVFDLARHFTLFRKAFDKEQMSSASASNFLSPGDTVTIHAKHAAKTRSVMLRITEMDPVNKFVEEQVKGDLLAFRHEHFFKQIENGTIMIDLVEYEFPRDFAGKMIARFFMKDYLEKIIAKRSAVIRQYAESERWKPLLAK